ncbi:MAG: hypothetical protein LBN04_05815 [Oscillospiraceae bacterium]|nr:hypothetical protein [Oscillospiraceae bacterium]
MKKVGWMMLVALLALCAFGGAAVADAYEIEELGLTFELEGDWEIYTGEAAEAMGARSARGYFGSEAACYFYAVPSNRTSDDTAIAWIMRNPSEEMSAELRSSLRTMRYGSGGMLPVAPPPDDTMQRMLASRALFGIAQITNPLYEHVAAFTTEQSTYIVMDAVISEKSAQLLDDVYAMLASCEFALADDALYPVNDPDAWMTAFEAKHAAYGGSFDTIMPRPYESESGLFFHNIYTDGLGTVSVVSDNPQTIGVIEVQFSTDYQLTFVEEEFYRLGALALMATLGETGMSSFVANVSLISDMIWHLRQEGVDGDTSYAMQWKGLELRVANDPTSEAIGLYIDM